MQIPLTQSDVTDHMRVWCDTKLDALQQQAPLCGFVLKSKSPSCGMERVKVYNDKNAPIAEGRGLFAHALMQRFPTLPVEEEGRLHDLRIRENFVERLFVEQRWRELIDQCPTSNGLEQFHRRHKLLFMARHADGLKLLGQIVAQGEQGDFSARLNAYHTGIHKLMATPARISRHVNALHHAMGYFKNQLTACDKQELLQSIEDYRAQNLPLIVPITLIRSYARRFECDYLLDQIYLNPHPKELKLRNHA
ncbi:hypothetical protein MAIT1_04317 [Magnetofaba australis IT-1]|uniref:DUF1722 domain-containing protein n=2 Tax=Magnetofaba TaxID=1472292 RepID=A0A1Y2K4W6_9PROT|nr:hypothetical protein MAIT1_04317 [Magnetofaba australis IT-1]